MGFISGKIGYVGVNDNYTSFNGSTGNITGGIDGAVVSGTIPPCVELTIDSDPTLISGMFVTVSNVVGTTEANGTWQITVIDATHIVLLGTAFSHAYVSGGTISRNFSFDSWDFTFSTVLPRITNVTSVDGFQALLSGNTKGTITTSGPYNNGTVALKSGTKYLWVLGISPTIFINVFGIVESMKIDNKASDSPKLNVTSQSNGLFRATIA